MPCARWKQKGAVLRRAKWGEEEPYACKYIFLNEMGRAENALRWSLLLHLYDSKIILSTFIRCGRAFNACAASICPVRKFRSVATISARSGWSSPFAPSGEEIVRRRRDIVQEEISHEKVRNVRFFALELFELRTSHGARIQREETLTLCWIERLKNKLHCLFKVSAEELDPHKMRRGRTTAEALEAEVVDKTLFRHGRDGLGNTCFRRGRIQAP